MTTDAALMHKVAKMDSDDIKVARTQVCSGDCDWDKQIAVVLSNESFDVERLLHVRSVNVVCDIEPISTARVQRSFDAKQERAAVADR